MSQGPFLRKYGVQATFNFDLFEVDRIDFRVDAAHASGDTKIMKDEGVEANTSNSFTDEGQGYSIVLTSTEMQAARIKVYIVDSATKVWLDTSIVIETYGNASAQHAFDLDTASTAQTIDVADILTTQMTEAYAADGAAPTLAQAVFLMLALVSEFSISGTTLTAKKLDGSTTAATFTLSDATNPTSITRAS